VIDETGASQMLLPENKRKKSIGVKEVEAWSPRWRASRQVGVEDDGTCCNLERDLKRVVFGQDKAIGAGRRHQAGARRPARAGKADRLLPVLRPHRRRQDRSRRAARQHRWASSCCASTCRNTWSATRSRRLIGAPPGYVGFDQGGLLTDGVDQHPHCVLLLDEIEKAHPDLFNILLQVMDHGKLTDHNGKKVDFRNVILIMTTNAGASEMAKARPSASAAASARARTRRRSSACSRRSSATASTRSSASRGLLAGDRRDGRREVRPAARRPARRPQRHHRARRRGPQMAGRARLRRSFGARPLGRVIQEHIKKPLADELLFGRPSPASGSASNSATRELCRSKPGAAASAAISKTTQRIKRRCGGG
jgi:ATP-dependent Clp protease ATP-binding subunit ClpA